MCCRAFEVAICTHVMANFVAIDTIVIGGASTTVGQPGSLQIDDLTINIATVDEPGSVGMLALAMLAFSVGRRRAAGRTALALQQEDSLSLRSVAG